MKLNKTEYDSPELPQFLPKPLLIVNEVQKFPFHASNSEIWRDTGFELYNQEKLETLLKCSSLFNFIKNNILLT